VAPKPEARHAFIFGMVLAVAVTILAVVTWPMAAPSESIYRPQLLLLY
jgi:hypothetical protein